MVHDDFPIPRDGIVGMDFLTEFNCTLDFMKNREYLFFRQTNFQPFAIPIQNTCSNDSLLLPVRSQVIRKIKLQTQHKELLVLNQEIQPGVYVANTLVQSDNAYVRILNNTKNDVTIKTLELKTENLEDYDVLSSKYDTQFTERKKQIQEKLSKNVPNQFKTELTTLCSNYADIFGLETETISTNNFYKQQLRLNDNTPTYIKSYRIPHSQKIEVEKEVNNLIDSDIVEPSTSEYNSPLLIVPKKSLPNSTEKRWRLVIDYREVNKKLLADKFP